MQTYKFFKASALFTSRSTKYPGARFFSTAASDQLVGQWLKQQATKYEHRDFMRHIEQQVRWTFTEYMKNVEALANGFADLQVIEKGWVTMLPNNVENAVTPFALAQVGSNNIALPPNFNIVSDLPKVFDAFLPRGIIIREKDLDNMNKIVEELNDWDDELGVQFRSQRFPSLKFIVHTGTTAKYHGTWFMESLVEWDRIDSQLEDIELTLNAKNTLATYVEIKGDKVESKGYTHAQILKAAQSVGEKLQLVVGDRILHGLPLYTHAGMATGLYAPLQFGAMTVIPSKSWNAEQALKAVETEKCNIIVGDADTFKSMMEHPRLAKTNFSTLSRVLLVTPSGSAQGLAQEIQKNFGVKKVVEINPSQI